MTESKSNKMTNEDWKQAWEQGDTGWHRSSYNLVLTENKDRLQCSQGDTIFFPLCGATLDMKWALEQGYQVKGVDVSALAIESFFQDHELAWEKQGNCYVGENIALFCCDIFDLTTEDLQGVRAIFDRGALVALHPDVRKRYFQHILSCLSQEVRILAEVFDYPEGVHDGPPFSIPRSYFEQELEMSGKVELLGQYKNENIEPSHPMHTTKAYLLTP